MSKREVQVEVDQAPIEEKFRSTIYVVRDEDPEEGIIMLVYESVSEIPEDHQNNVIAEYVLSDLHKLSITKELTSGNVRKH